MTLNPENLIVTLGTLLVVVAALGLVLLLMVARRVKLLDRRVDLKRYRSKKEGFTDLLNYAALVDDGVIVGKNGSFMAGWEYFGIDEESCTDENRERVSYRINQALAELGSGWMIHVDAVRSPVAAYSAKGESFFPDRVTRAIDEERRQFFEDSGSALFRSYFVLTVTWFPPILARKKFTNLMFTDHGEKDSGSHSFDLVAKFNKEIKQLEHRLSSAVELKRLKATEFKDGNGNIHTQEEFLSHLEYCMSGTRLALRPPVGANYLDGIWGEEFWSGVIPKVGKRFVQTIAIDGFPESSHPGMLSALNELPLEYRWSTRYICMDSHEALNSLDKIRKKWRQKIRGFSDQIFSTDKGPVDRHAVSMTDDAEEAMATVNSGSSAMGYYTSVVVILGESRPQIEENAQAIAKVINQLGFKARIETLNTVEAYFGSLPGHGVQNIRRQILSTLNLGDLLPTSSLWMGDSRAPCPMYKDDNGHQPPALLQTITVGATPFWLNLHVRDIGHTLMFGPTGAGKSTHLGLIAAQLRRYKGMNIFAFDKGNSLYPLTLASGGLHLPIAVESMSFCPLQYLETASDMAWSAEWLEAILVLNGITVTTARRNAIANALTSIKNTGGKTLSVFCLTIQDIEVREALKPYVQCGLVGSLFDANHDGLSLSNFTTFELESLLNMENRFSLPALLYIFRRIERSLNGQPAAILLDEAWIMLGHAVFKEKIREWLKVLRKSNCLVIMATQSLSDAKRSGILDVLVESCPTKIFLPNMNAKEEDTAALYRSMGLNQKNIETIATALPKSEYLIAQEDNQRLYDLALGPIAMSFIGATDKKSLARIKELHEQHGDGWIDIWLGSRGLSLNEGKGANDVKEYCA